MVADGTPLNPGEQFTLERDKRYVLVGLGSILVSAGQLRPQLVQLDALRLPGDGKAVVRFTHGLARSPDPVDIYVNGEVVRSIGFAQSSAPPELDARAENEDSLIMVATGVVPDGSNEIYRSVGATLFRSGRAWQKFVDTHGPVPRAVLIVLWQIRRHAELDALNRNARRVCYVNGDPELYRSGHRVIDATSPDGAQKHDGQDYQRSHVSLLCPRSK